MINIKYWEVRTETPYFGEDCRKAVAAETYDEVEVIAWDIMYNNAMEWYDDEAAEEYDWDDYLGGCDVSIYEITYGEYLKMLKKGV